MRPFRASPSSRLFAVLLFVFSLGCLGALTGCNGGGDSADASASSAPVSAASDDSMTGVAAIGRALDGYAYIQDIAGAVINVPIGADGTYSANTTGMQPPFIVRVQASDARIWYSYAPSRVPANVSQLTTLVLFLANDKGDLDDLFTNWPRRFMGLTDAAILYAQAVVNLNFSALFDRHGLDHRVYNFFTMPFAPDGTGFDAVLDAIGSISFGNGTYRFSNAVHQAAFDENIAVTDPAMLDSLGYSLTIISEPIDLGSGSVIVIDPLYNGVLDPLVGGGTLEPSPTDAVGMCGENGYICPEGMTCNAAECPDDDSSNVNGVISIHAGSTAPPLDDVVPDTTNDGTL